MIIEGIVIGAAVATLVDYLKNKSFRAVVSADLKVVDIEVTALKTKAASAGTVVEADFAKAVTAVKSLFSKL